MIYSTATIPVNPAGARALTRDQVWAGLVLKARDAGQFLPPGMCTRCEVLFEGKDHLMREAVILGDTLHEFVSFVPKQKVSFHQVKSPREGVIVNEINEDASGQLQLRFYAYLGLLGEASGSDKERDQQAMLDSDERGYPAALRATLARTRALVLEGKL